MTVILNNGLNDLFIYLLCVFVTYNQLQAATFMTWKDQQLFLQTGT